MIVKIKAQYVVKSNYLCQSTLLKDKSQLTKVATIVASSQPWDLVMRNRTHKRSPTASHAQTTSVIVRTNTILPSVTNS